VFVAGFIGSLAMNLIAAEVAQGEDHGLSLTAGGLIKPRDMVLPERGRSILLGVRPEHLTIVGGQDDADFEMKVSAVEALGADTLVHGYPAGATQEGDMLVARLPGSSRVEAGDVLPLAIRPGASHLFDAD